MDSSRDAAEPRPAGRTPRRRTAVLATAGALSGLGLATALVVAPGANAESSPSADTAGQRTSTARAKAPALRACNGGALKRMRSIGTNDELAVGLGDRVQLLKTPLVVAGPAKGTDTLVITFTGDTQLLGDGGMVGAITVGGVVVTTPRLPLPSATGISSAATQVCTTIRKGNHKIAMNVSRTPGSTWGNGYVDNWLLRVDVLE